MISLSGSVEISPSGPSPASRAAKVRPLRASVSEAGPRRGIPAASRNTAPAERSAVATGRPWLSTSPSKTSPAECATMNQAGTPQAVNVPIMAPAEVPTM
jgi:hypothetical protein